MKERGFDVSAVKIVIRKLDKRENRCNEEKRFSFCHGIYI